MTPAEREAAVRGYWGRVWTAGELDAVGDFYALEFLLNDDVTTVADFRSGVAQWRRVFPDFSVEVTALFPLDGDRVLTRVRYRGTHLGDFTSIDLRATGKAVESTGLDVFRFEHGKCVEHWHETDHYPLLLELGATVSGA